MIWTIFHFFYQGIGKMFIIESAREHMNKACTNLGHQPYKIIIINSGIKGDVSRSILESATDSILWDVVDAL